VRRFDVILTQINKPLKAKKGKKMSSTIEINGETYVKQSDIVQKPKGDYVVIRTYSAGVHCGYLKSRNGKEVVLTNTRRIHTWQGAATLSQIAGDGISKPKECKLPAPIEEILLTEAIEIIPCTKEAQKIIEGIPVWKV
tara:strand:- start:986 stop:1402 length:417 start_codon:yes stop_codon:yes gene_type:complete